MRIVVPYTNLRPEVRDALDAYSAEVEYVRLGRRVTSYWALMCRLWADQEDFMLFEHDIVPPIGLLKAFEDCPEPWCSGPSDGMALGHKNSSVPHLTEGFHAAWLQANRFRRRIMVEHPGVFSGITEMGRHWTSLDSASIYRLEGGNCCMPPHETVSCCVHWDTPTKHLHVYGQDEFANRCESAARPWPAAAIGAGGPRPKCPK